MSSAKKIVILGQFGVGKTSLTRRFVDQAFSEDYLVTLGVQIKKKTLTLKNGVEKTLIDNIPEITEIIDSTDHTFKDNAFYK